MTPNIGFDLLKDGVKTGGLAARLSAGGRLTGWALNQFLGYLKFWTRPERLRGRPTLATLFLLKHLLRFLQNYGRESSRNPLTL